MRKKPFEVKKQPIALPLTTRQKLENLADEMGVTMNDVIIHLIEKAPTKKQTQRALRE